MSKKVLTHELREPLGAIAAASIEINTGTGNLTIDRLPEGAPLLASGSLQYLEDQQAPVCSVDTRDGEVSLTLKAGGTGRPSFRLPWQACNGATTWDIHVNPRAVSTISAHSGGGNVNADLSGAAVSRVSADTGGGNVDVVLPDNAGCLDVTIASGAGNVTLELGGSVVGEGVLRAKSGAGNVVVRLPGGLPARIHATSGMGKVIVDPCYTQVGKDLYQSQDYELRANKTDITLHSGAGNVIVEIK